MAKDWDIIITNKSNLLSIDLQEIWHYRDLLSMYVKRDIITFYKQTILGSLWLIFRPLFTNNYVHVCVWWHCRNLYLHDPLRANLVREMVYSH